MECKLCGKPAKGACAKCGGFFCEAHGGEDAWQRARCSRCYDKERSGMTAYGVVAIILGLIVLGLAVRCLTIGEEILAGVVLLFSLVLFAGAAWQLGNARKVFPKPPG